MELKISYGLPFIDILVKHKGKEISISHILIDTGSAKSILSADILGTIGVYPSPKDRLRKVKGIGGNEIVFEKCIEFVIVDKCSIKNCTVQVGAMNYGFEINGILGIDYLTTSKAIIDIDKNILSFF
jgi:hypothetical protein